MAFREPIEPPGGFSPSPKPDDPSVPEVKPDWLVGADDGIDFKRPGPDTPRPSLSRPSARPGEEPPPPRRPAARPGARRPAEDSGPPSALEPPAPEAWSAAGSSIPKLTVVPQRERPARETSDEEEELGTLDPLDAGLEGEDEPSAEPGAPVAPEEPWWLVAVETLATNRVLQIGVAAAAAALLLWTFWPRKENESASIAAIKQHPQRFEGQSVRIRGEVGEVFDEGSGVVFELRQHRDTLVVFSPSRRPSTHDHVTVQGTVSTGYLDGTPRVALFEAAGAQAP